LEPSVHPGQQPGGHPSKPIRAIIRDLGRQRGVAMIPIRSPGDGSRRRLAKALAQSGLGQPDVTVRVTGDLPRNPGSDKLRRFVPLPEMACR
jgi:hypothetical protein